MKYKVVSLFSGAGGMDLGFTKAGFEVIWANEFDKSIWETYEKNHSNFLCKKSIVDVNLEEVPDHDVLIGGPPCQSWSVAGNRKGIEDPRGKLIYEYKRILENKKPKVFVMENVQGMLTAKNKPIFLDLINFFSEAGYNVKYKLLNASDYNVPQDRKRVIIVGVRLDIKKEFIFPSVEKKVDLKSAIFDLKDTAKPALEKNYKNKKLDILNHEYFIGGFSSIYMSRNRVRAWDEQSFTIQASGRQAPLHPQAPKMPLVSKDKREFKKNYEHLYRRITVREAARIQTFPDDFEFIYENVNIGYKMIGNAVPVNMAKAIAISVRKVLELK